MAATRSAAALAVALLLAACSGGAAPPAPAPPSPPPPPPPSPPAATAEPAGARPVPEALAEPAPGVLRQVAFAAGDVIGAAGIYFLNVATGTGEGWIYPGGSAYWGNYVSDDNRFVIAYAGEDGYLIDRHGGAVRRWDPTHIRPLLADAGGFLFAEVKVERQGGNRVETGRYIWAGPDLKPLVTFTLDGGGASGFPPLLSPDGRRLALLSSDRKQVALVDLGTGELQRLDAPPAGHIGAAALRRYGEGFQVELLAWEGEPTGAPLAWHYAVRRFSWRGEPLRDLRIPGNYVFFSPDGKWVAWEQWPAGDLAPVTVVADAGSLQPRLQALGATPCFQMAASGGTRWLGDSSGLVVATAAGYRLLTLDGKLQDRPAFAGLIWKGEPQPAPDHPDRFAIGRLAVVNGAGTQRLGVTLQNFVTPTSLSPWGATSAELRFAVPPPARGGACGERPPMPAQVLLPARQLPAFPLVVRSTGVCLDLRDRPHGTGNALACLPGGTRLAALRLRSDISSITWLDQSWWLSVTTEKGETGWVSLAGGQVDWAVS